MYFALKTHSGKFLSYANHHHYANEICSLPCKCEMDVCFYDDELCFLAALCRVQFGNQREGPLGFPGICVGSNTNLTNLGNVRSFFGKSRTWLSLLKRCWGSLL